VDDGGNYAAAAAAENEPPVESTGIQMCRICPECSVLFRICTATGTRSLLMIAAPARSRPGDFRADPRSPRACGLAARATPLASAPGSCPPTPPLERLAVEIAARREQPPHCDRAKSMPATVVRLGQEPRRRAGAPIIKRGLGGKHAQLGHTNIDSRQPDRTKRRPGGLVLDNAVPTGT
jgi:hypothetical protein